MLQRARRNRSASGSLGVLTPVTAKDAQFPLINRVQGPPASEPLNRIPQSNILVKRSREMSQASHPGGTFLYTSSVHLKMILMTRGWPRHRRCGQMTRNTQPDMVVYGFTICIIWCVLCQFPAWDCNPLPVCRQSSVTAALLSVINQWSSVCHPALPGSNDHDSTQYLFSKYPTFTLSTAISLALNSPNKRQYKGASK